MSKEILAKSITPETKTYKSISNDSLTLCDPITQICKRIEGFLKGDKDITCRYIVNNQKPLEPKIDPDTGNPYTKQVEYDGETVTAIIDEDHLCEFRLFVADVEKAQCLANVIRHLHTFPEMYVDTEGTVHVRNHYLIVRVMVVTAVDPDGQGGGSNPWISDDDTDSGVTEIFGLDPIDWSDPESDGCNDRLAPSDTSESDIPKGVPEEYEQKQWETTEVQTAWKWKWLKTALKGNKNIVSLGHEFSDGMNVWRFIECNCFPIVIAEDNLASLYGLTSILPADLLPLVFSVFGKFQIGTYARSAS